MRVLKTWQKQEKKTKKKQVRRLGCLSLKMETNRLDGTEIKKNITIMWPQNSKMSFVIKKKKNRNSLNHLKEELETCTG